MRAVGRGSFSFGSSRLSSRKLEEIEIQQVDETHEPSQVDPVPPLNNTGGAALEGPNERVMEGFLVFRGRVRRRRYCILKGGTILVFKSKPNDSASPGVPTKEIIVAGVKDAVALEKSVRVSLLGNGAPNSYDSALVITSHKSKLVVIEADTHIEKERWLHAMSTIHLDTGSSEKDFFQSLLSVDGFDAHMAVTLLHKHRTNVVATELVLDRLAAYAEQNVDDVEFYIQQIVHLIVNTELAATDKLVNLLLSICRAKTYVEHLGNCIHLALQLFWLLEAKIADNDPKTYNLCAKLLMSIEAKVVNQQFELPSTQTAADLTQRLMDIPRMKEKLEQMSTANHDAINLKAELSRPVECTTNCPPDPPASPRSKEQATLLLQWMEKERQKRYKYFHQQRDFVKALSDISERMRAVDPPQNRKKLLPAELTALVIPDMAYVPLGRVSDPFCRITRVLVAEGTVFSTHSRAPCLLCFEVIEDQVNSAGQRVVTSPKASRSGSFDVFASGLPSEAEVANLIKKFTINGQLICFENASVADDDDDIETAPDSQQPCDSPTSALQDLESALSSPTATLESLDSVEASMNSTDSSELSASGSQRLSLIRGFSKTAYEMGLSKLLSATETFGESWQAKKERIRAASPFGQQPGWNVISLVGNTSQSAHSYLELIVCVL